MDIEHIKVKEDYAVVDLMTPAILGKLREWSKIGRDAIKKLYWTKAWKRLRKEIIKYDHNECQLCKANGTHRTATMVHHVKHLENNLSLGLSTTYEDEDGKTYRQLISLCDDCHDCQHPKDQDPREILTEERW